MRRGRNRNGATGDAVRCRMCGRAVAVGRDGRCVLGHFVGLPQADVAAAPAAGAAPADGAAPYAVPEPVPVPVPAVGHAGAPPAGPRPAPGAVAAAPRPPAAPAPEPPAGPPPTSVSDDVVSDLLADFGDLGGLDDLGGLSGLDDLGGVGDLGAGSGLGGFVPHPADGTDTVDLFGDLGTDLAGAPAVPAARPPRLQPPPPAAPGPWSSVPVDRQTPPGIDDLLGWDATASALDAELPAPAGDAVGTDPSPGAADPDGATAAEAAIVEDQEALDAEDRRVARRRALGILGGAVAAVATVVGSILALPL